jgi:hypothetical protein
MTEQAFSRNDLTPQRATGDLLARLYREIGISAVAAALQMKDDYLASASAGRSAAPASLQVEHAHAMRP